MSSSTDPTGEMDRITFRAPTHLCVKLSQLVDAGLENQSEAIRAAIRNLDPSDIETCDNCRRGFLEEAELKSHYARTGCQPRRGESDGE